MAAAKITRRYHRNDGARLKGDVITTVEQVSDLFSATDWAEALNEMHEEYPYHITGIHIDNRNFSYFDLSVFDDEYDMADYEWREILLAA